MSFNVVILGSGRGSNAQALLEAERSGNLGDARIVALFSDQAEARILSLGEKYGKPARYLDPGRKGARFSREGEALYVKEIKVYEPRLIVLAGFMRIVAEPFIKAFGGRVINLHPSLLPAFPGLDSLGQAIAAGVRIAGCTVHWVTAELDAGPIIDQQAFRIDPGASRPELEGKLRAAEHNLLPEVVCRLSKGESSPPF